MRVYRFFFFNDTATTEIYTLSLHDALPIFFIDSDDTIGDLALERIVEALATTPADWVAVNQVPVNGRGALCVVRQDRKSTRLNSSHANISYAVFCLKKKKKMHHT